MCKQTGRKLLTMFKVFWTKVQASPKQSAHMDAVCKSQQAELFNLLNALKANTADITCLLEQINVFLEVLIKYRTAL